MQYQTHAVGIGNQHLAILQSVFMPIAAVWRMWRLWRCVSNTKCQQVVCSHLEGAVRDRMLFCLVGFLMKIGFKRVKVTTEWIDLVSTWGLGDKRWVRKENTEFAVFIRQTVQLFCFSLRKNLENLTPKGTKWTKLVRGFHMICSYPVRCVRDKYWDRYLLFKWYLLFKKKKQRGHTGADKGNFFLTYFVNDVCLMGFAPSTSSILIPWQLRWII